MRLLPALLLVSLLAAAPALAQAPARPAQYRAALATPDGVRATLYRYVPAAGAARTILLLPDVGMTRHAFDWAGRGLALHLQEAGWEVYVVEYRGAGRSEVPFGGYSLEDLLDADAEAAFARAGLERERIAVGGVGLGATFALALAARHPDRVLGVVALQPLIAPDVPNEPAAKALARMKNAPPWLDLATLTKEKLYRQRSVFEILLANDGSFEEGELLSLRRHVLAPVPREAALQLGQAMTARRLELAGRAAQEIVRGWPGRTLLVFAPRDNWVHPEFAVPVRDLLPRGACKVVVLDVLGGAHRDYGHLGMLLGRQAPQDVFVHVARFLAEVAP